MKTHLAAVFVLLLACGGSSTSEPATTGGGNGMTCQPLASFAGACPADWTAAKKDKDAFCASRQGPDFDAFVSTDACRGYLRYTKHLFDGGPRYCVYDPATGKLTGYHAHDGKAMYDAFSCGVDRAAYEDTGCNGTSC